MNFFFYLIILIFFFNLSSYSKEVKILDIDKYKINNEKNYLIDFKSFASKDNINVVIEIPMDTNEKWEVSKINGSLEHDFYMGKPRLIEFSPYPVNYGMIPRTVVPLRYGGDGDPLDVIVLGKKIPRGTVLSAKVIGEMQMSDMGETDNKIIAVYNGDKFYKYNDIFELNTNYPKVLNEIKFWFLNYKKENLVEFHRYRSKEDALKSIILASKYFEKYGIKAR